MYPYIPIPDESIEVAIQAIWEAHKSAGRPTDSLLWAEAFSTVANRIREAVADREMATIQTLGGDHASNDESDN